MESDAKKKRCLRTGKPQLDQACKCRVCSGYFQTESRPELPDPDEDHVVSCDPRLAAKTHAEAVWYVRHGENMVLSWASGAWCYGDRIQFTINGHGFDYAVGPENDALIAARLQAMIESASKEGWLDGPVGDAGSEMAKLALVHDGSKGIIGYWS